VSNRARLHPDRELGIAQRPDECSFAELDRRRFPKRGV
jgi:hypothetical protein